MDGAGDRGWTNSGLICELLWSEECRETNPTVSAGLCAAGCFVSGLLFSFLEFKIVEVF